MTVSIKGVASSALPAAAPETATTAATVTTTYELQLGSTVEGSYATLAQAQAAAIAKGPGSYTITPQTTTTTVVAGTPVTYVVAATSPDNTVITAPTTATITALGHVWGIVGGQVTVDGVADSSTHAVTQLAWENGELWQCSTNLGAARWWGTTAVPAIWQPAGGTTTSPIPSSGGGSGGGSNPPPPSGPGITIAGGRFYDSKKVEFYPQGVNELHFDDSSAASPTSGLALSGANIVRYWFDGQGYPMSRHVANIKNYLAAKIVVMGCQSYYANGAQTTGSTAALTDIIAWWVNNSDTLAPLLNAHGMVNVANEWGPANSPAWDTQCIAALRALRAAPTPYTCPLIFDSGGYGQDAADLLNYSTAVAAADPLKNTGFSFHLYGNTPSVAAMQTTFAALRALANTNGAAYLIGEFGPGRNIGPSPTLITPDQVIAAARSNHLGWLAWAWDNNDLGGGASDNNSFSMTLQGPGYYTGLASQLTTYGQDIVGQLKSAAKATDFT